jgi:hypothetical protein
MYTSKDIWVVAGSLTGIRSAMAKHLSVAQSSCLRGFSCPQEQKSIQFKSDECGSQVVGPPLQFIGHGTCTSRLKCAEAPS